MSASFGRRSATYVGVKTAGLAPHFLWRQIRLQCLDLLPQRVVLRRFALQKVLGKRYFGGKPSGGEQVQIRQPVLPSAHVMRFHQPGFSSARNTKFTVPTLTPSELASRRWLCCALRTSSRNANKLSGSAANSPSVTALVVLGVVKTEACLSIDSNLQCSQPTHSTG